MVFKSPYPDYTPPARFNESFSEFIWQQLDKYANDTLIVDYNSKRSWTGSQIKRSVGCIARNLIVRAAIKLGDRCVVLCPNSDYCHLIAIGVILAGGTVCGGLWKDPDDEFRRLIEQVNAALVIADLSLYERLVSLRAKYGLEFKLCIVGDISSAESYDDATTLVFHRHLLTSDDNLESQNNPAIPVCVGPDDLAYIFFTSGSTGKRKPVPKSHRGLIYAAFNDFTAPSLYNMSKTSVMPSYTGVSLPSYMFFTLRLFAAGLKAILIDGFSKTELLSVIEHYKVTHLLIGAAYLCQFADEEASKRDLSSLKTILTIGCQIPSIQLARDLMNKYPNLSIKEVYGSTEASTICSSEVSRGVGDKVRGCIAPNMRVKVIDLDTSEEITNFDKCGELLVSGPAVATKYLGEELAEISRNSFLPDGFYRTGDIACVSSNNEVYVCGRVRDTLYLESLKAHPAEIEAVLLEHPSVLEAAVIGVPHPKLTGLHVVRAFIVKKNGYELTEAEIIEFMAKRVTKPKQLHGGVKLLDGLPKLSFGKIDRKRLHSLEV